MSTLYTSDRDGNIYDPQGNRVDLSKPSARLARVVATMLTMAEQEIMRQDMYQGPRRERFEGMGS